MADGQCAIIVEQGVVVDICAEVGEFTYDNTVAPSVFCGKLGEGIAASFKEFGKRFVMGGESYRITDPILFYKNIAGNVSKDYTREYMNEALAKKWGARGISVVSVAMNPINLSDEDKKAIKEVQLQAGLVLAAWLIRVSSVLNAETPLVRRT